MLFTPFKVMMLLIQYNLFGHREKTPNRDLVGKKPMPHMQ
jgi:hypothetical protein